MVVPEGCTTSGSSLQPNASPYSTGAPGLIVSYSPFALQQGASTAPRAPRSCLTSLMSMEKGDASLQAVLCLGPQSSTCTNVQHIGSWGLGIAPVAAASRHGVRAGTGACRAAPPLTRAAHADQKLVRTRPRCRQRGMGHMPILPPHRPCAPPTSPEESLLHLWSCTSAPAPRSALPDTGSASSQPTHKRAPCIRGPALSSAPMQPLRRAVKLQLKIIVAARRPAAL